MAKQQIMSGVPPPSDGHRGEDHFVQSIMYTSFAPLIVYPGWEDEFRARKMEAIAHRIKHQKEILEHRECTEYEAMLYISSATLVAPIEHDWGQVYMWLFQRCRPDVAEANDIKPDRPELNSQQREKLAGLRRWVFRQQTDNLKGETKGRQRETKLAQGESKAPKPETVEVIQARMF